MKKSLLAVALFACAAIASASGLGGVVVVGGGASVYGGTLNAGASSISGGEATSATFISGAGYSNQFTTGSVVGSSFAGGTITSQGVTANTATFQQTDFSSVGSIGGGAQAMNAGSQVLNGTTGFGTVKNDAISAGTFTKSAIGGVIGIGGFAGLVGF